MQRLQSSLAQPTLSRSTVVPSPYLSHTEKKNIRNSSPSRSTPIIGSLDALSPKIARRLTMKDIQTPSITKTSSISSLFSPPSTIRRVSSVTVPTSGIGCTNENINVYLRLRPLNIYEKNQGGQECIHVSDSGNEVEIVSLNSAYGPVRDTFSYHKVFGITATQEDVFRTSTSPLIENFFAGYNATILAYGQTGSGKTFTMTSDSSNAESMGIIPRTAIDIFHCAKRQFRNKEIFDFSVNFIEIYNETIRDLLDERTKVGSKSLQIREDSFGEFFVSEVNEVPIYSAEDLLDLMRKGSKNRAVGATNMNEYSSRSHSVCTVTLTRQNATRDVTTISKLVLVDLAGSETIKKSGAEGGQLKETTAINLSLSTLGQVINALSNKSSKHIPYRNSSLTKLLKTSLGGNSKTALIITCSPSSNNATESLSSLRFGERAKTIVNKSIINETRAYASTVDASLLAEIAELKEALRQAHSNGKPIEDDKADMVLESLLKRAVEDAALIEKQRSDIANLTRSLEDKDALLLKTHKELADANSRNTGVEHFQESMMCKLRESVRVNNELIEKMALIAELRQLDTLRARLHDVIEAHSPIFMDQSPVSLTKKPIEVTSPKIQNTNDSVNSLALFSRNNTPLKAIIASDSPYPSPEESPPQSSFVDSFLVPEKFDTFRNKENGINRSQSKRLLSKAKVSSVRSDKEVDDTSTARNKLRGMFRTLFASSASSD